MHRCETRTTEEGDTKEEMEHLRGFLRVWLSIPGLEKDHRQHKREEQDQRRTKNKDYTSQVVIPYVEGVSERVHRVKKKYGVVTAVRSHTTLMGPSGTSTMYGQQNRVSWCTRYHARTVVPGTLERPEDY